MEPKSNKTIVLECYRKIIRDLDLSLVDSYVHEDYIQHSPTVKDGRAGLLEMLAFLKTLPKPAVPGPSPIIRVIADGDLVAVHLDIEFMAQHVAVIDLFRLRNGKIAEHWDAGQPLAPIGDEPITMTNGRTAIDETADKQVSKTMIRDFYGELFRSERDDAVAKFLAHDYVEHNVANGLVNSTNGEFKVHRIIGEGDFVAAHVERLASGQSFAQMHLFRVAGGKVAEHWSVEQQVPETMAHGNGMF
ncbi:nuclear transport factor 2 family protein [Mucilaginibacter xinganensis]|nr:nuclear transport factor 2 family protein [Mucilaginibacter xinganensis]